MKIGTGKNYNMKIKLKKIPREFKVGLDGKTIIKDFGKIKASKNEMLSFVNSEGKEYDIVAKDWGFYATPSINGRLINQGYKTALVKNSFGKYYIMIVDIDKLRIFKNYLTKDNQTLIEWLDEKY